MKLSNLPFKFESGVVQWWYRITASRPASQNYLSGDGFRSLTPWRFEPENRGSFPLAKLPAHALVFCDGWLLQEFLTTIAPQITQSFSILSHNADPNWRPELVQLFPSKLQLLVANNVLFVHDRVLAVPIGLENARLHYNGVVGDFDRLRKKKTTKKPRILAAFTVGTNLSVREPALKALALDPKVDTLERINSRSYRKVAVTYQYIASPPGNGEDCHRTWEALYLGCIPIVIRSALTQSFVDQGLPLWLVDSYQELAALSPDQLDQLYSEWLPRLQTPALWMPYWIRQIETRLSRSE